MSELKPDIIREGQRYWDEPKYVLPKINSLGAAVTLAFNGALPKPILTHHERVRLNWKKPVFDKEGNVVGLLPR